MNTHVWRAVLAFLTTLTLGIAPSALAQKYTELAQTPPMGWNSWNHYGCNIDERLIRSTADALVSSGLRDAGYVYVNLDDCWHGARDAHGDIQPDAKRFPSGLKALGDYIHARGLKFGIYSDTGEKTCAGFPGSQGHEYQDARQYAAWGVDYVKYDWCNTGTGENQRNAREGYRTMRDAIRASGRPMVFSICEWGENKPWLWATDVGHLWRTTGDITNCWDCEVGHGNWSSLGVLRILDKQNGLRDYAGPGHWNDPDMMEVGNLPVAEQNRSHFAMWAMLAAPLIVGTDVEAMTPATRAILENRRIIAIDQDALGIPGWRWLGTAEVEIWARPLAGGDWAVAVLNRSAREQPVTIDWTQQQLRDDKSQIDAKLQDSPMKLTELWQGMPAGTTAKPLAMKLKPFDTAIYRLSRK